jgi:hypothetical protein
LPRLATIPDKGEGVDEITLHPLASHIFIFNTFAFRRYSDDSKKLFAQYLWDYNVKHELVAMMLINANY